MAYKLLIQQQKNLNIGITDRKLEIKTKLEQYSTEPRPKIKFYLFAIAYLPTLLLPTQLFFLLFQK